MGCGGVSPHKKAGGSKGDAIPLCGGVLGGQSPLKQTSEQGFLRYKKYLTAPFFVVIPPRAHI